MIVSRVLFDICHDLSGAFVGFLLASRFENCLDLLRH